MQSGRSPLKIRLSSPSWPPQKGPAGCIRAPLQLSNQNWQLSSSHRVTCNRSNQCNREVDVTRRLREGCRDCNLTTPTTRLVDGHIHNISVCFSHHLHVYEWISLHFHHRTAVLIFVSHLQSTSLCEHHSKFHQRVKVCCLSQATQTWPCSLFWWRKSS